MTKYMKTRDSGKTSISTAIANAVRDGTTLLEVATQWPGYALLHGQCIARYRALVYTTPASPPFNLLTLPGNSFHQAGSRLISWLDAELGRSDRDIKSPNLWLWGDSNTGKSTLLKKLRLAGIRILNAPYEGEYWTRYNDNDYDLVVMDEYGAQYTTLFLRQFTDGTDMEISRKYLDTYPKQRNIPTLICANTNIQQTYSKCNDRTLQALRNRFEEIELVACIGPVYGPDTHPENCHCAGYISDILITKTIITS